MKIASDRPPRQRQAGATPAREGQAPLVHPYDSFVTRHEKIQDRAAEFAYERGLRIAKRFESELYNSDKLTDVQQREAYKLIREDPAYLAERHSHFAKLDKLPEGILHDGFLEDLAKNEAAYQEAATKAARPIDLTFPNLGEGPELGG